MDIVSLKEHILLFHDSYYHTTCQRKSTEQKFGFLIFSTQKAGEPITIVPLQEFYPEKTCLVV